VLPSIEWLLTELRYGREIDHGSADFEFRIAIADGERKRFESPPNGLVAGVYNNAAHNQPFIIGQRGRTGLMSPFARTVAVTTKPLNTRFDRWKATKCLPRGIIPLIATNRDSIVRISSSITDRQRRSDRERAPSFFGVRPAGVPSIVASTGAPFGRHVKSNYLGLRWFGVASPSLT